jgi:hypothetical protein
MPMDEHAVCRAQVEAHFAGRVGSAEERGMRQHLAECPACRRRYGRHWILSELDPHALGAYERIGRGLGFLKRPSRMRPAGVLLVAATFACVIGLVVGRFKLQEREFAARGASRSPWALIEVYHAKPERPFEPAAGKVGRSDELAFAYANGAGYPYLVVCGLDEHGHVYWYHPAWTSMAEDPEAVRVEKADTIRELPEAISQAIDGSKLRIVAVFARRALHVREVEREIDRAGQTNGDLGAALTRAFGDVLVIEQKLEVAP